LAHRIVVGRVEGEGGGGQPVGDQVDPEQLDRREGLWHAQRGSEEDAGHLETKGCGYWELAKNK